MAVELKSDNVKGYMFSGICNDKGTVLHFNFHTAVSGDKFPVKSEITALIKTTHGWSESSKVTITGIYQFPKIEDYFSWIGVTEKHKVDG